MKSRYTFPPESKVEMGNQKGRDLTSCSVKLEDGKRNHNHEQEHKVEYKETNVLFPVVRPHSSQNIHATVFHRMCKHRGVKAMERMAHYMGVKIVGVGWRERIMKCEYCLKNKIKRTPHFKDNHHTVEHQPGAHLTMDTQGWWNTVSWDGKKYKFTIKCLASNFELDYYLRHKNEFLPCFLKAIAFFERHTGSKVKFITCDQEYNLYKEFQVWLDESQVVLLEAPTGEKQAVAKVERSHQTNGGPARALLSDAELPQSFWTEMERNATYINNLLPISHGIFKGKSPYEVIHKRKPYLHHLRPIGCAAVMKVKARRGKGERGRKVIFLGYERDSGYYRVYDPVDHTIHRNVRDVVFDVWKLGKREASKELENRVGGKEPMFSVGWDTPIPEHTQRIEPEMGTHNPNSADRYVREGPLIEVALKDNVPTETVTLRKPITKSPLGQSENSDGRKENSENAPLTTYNYNYDSLPELEPPSPTSDSRGSIIQQGEEKTVPTKGGKEKTVPTKVGRKRGRKIKERIILSGKNIRVPARMWGEGWARTTYGDQWETAERKGTTLGPTAPVVRKTKRFPAHNVAFDDGVTDKMIDSEIIKYEYDAGANTAPHIIPNTEVTDKAEDPHIISEFGFAEGEREKAVLEKEKHGKDWRSHNQGEITDDNVIPGRTRSHITICAREDRVDYCLVSEQTPEFPKVQKPKDRRQAREKEVRQQEELKAFEWRRESDI